MALTSPENKGNFKLAIPPDKDRPTSTSFRKVYTEGIMPNCNLDTTADDLCATPNSTPSTLTTIYDALEHRIGLSIKRELVLDLKGFKAFCKDPEQVINDWIQSQRSGVLEEIDKKAIVQLVAMMGNYADGVNSITTPKTINVINPTATGTSIDATAFARIAQEYQKIGFAPKPIIVGGGQLALADIAKQYYTGTSDVGQQFKGLPGLYADYNVDADFADAFYHALTWAPGTFQLVNYNDISDLFVQYSVKNIRERSRVTSPFGDGLSWDLYVDLVNNGCTYVIKFQTWFDVIQPVPYNTCIQKPAQHWQIGCGANTCATLGFA